MTSTWKGFGVSHSSFGSTNNEPKNVFTLIQSERDSLTYIFYNTQYTTTVEETIFVGKEYKNSSPNMSLKLLYESSQTIPLNRSGERKLWFARDVPFLGYCRCCVICKRDLRKENRKDQGWLSTPPIYPPTFYYLCKKPIRYTNQTSDMKQPPIITCGKCCGKSNSFSSSFETIEDSIERSSRKNISIMKNSNLIGTNVSISEQKCLSRICASCFASQSSVVIRGGFRGAINRNHNPSAFSSNMRWTFSLRMEWSCYACMSEDIERIYRKYLCIRRHSAILDINKIIMNHLIWVELTRFSLSTNTTPSNNGGNCV